MMMVHYQPTDPVTLYPVYAMCGGVYSNLTKNAEQVTCPECLRRMAAEVEARLGGTQSTFPPGHRSR